MAYLGLVPRENTSSERRRQGHITNGQRPRPLVIVECASITLHRPSEQGIEPAHLRAIGSGTAISWRAQNRLHSRYRRCWAAAPAQQGDRGHRAELCVLSGNCCVPKIATKAQSPPVWKEMVPGEQH